MYWPPVGNSASVVVEGESAVSSVTDSELTGTSAAAFRVAVNAIEAWFSIPLLPFAICALRTNSNAAGFPRGRALLCPAAPPAVGSGCGRAGLLRLSRLIPKRSARELGRARCQKRM